MIENANTPRAKQTRTPTRRHKDSPLTEADWVEAATDILVRENVRGIRIDALCQKLGVTKGSFYWHFKTRAELLRAMLRNWQRRMTLNVIHNLSRSDVSSAEKLRSLISLPRRPKSPAFAQIEQSIRDWGRRDQGANETVSEVDLIRMEYFSQLFRDQGFDEATARRRSYLAYTMMMGDSILHRTLGSVSSEEMVEEAVGILLTGLPDTD